MDNEAHARGWRDHLDLANASPRCSAQRRDGQPCRQGAMPNGKCRMHGGASTGPRTPEGLARSRKANWRHGYYSAQAKAERQEARAIAWVLRHWTNLLSP